MLPTALTAVTDKLDLQFLSAYFMPAFVAVAGIAGILAARNGGAETLARLEGMTSVEQTLLLLIALLVVLMLSFVLRALTFPIFELFAGLRLPRAAVGRLIAGQVGARRRALRALEAQATLPGQTRQAMLRMSMLDLRYPHEEGETAPTTFGNVFAAAADHPAYAYNMPATLWMPRLMPLLPDDYRSTISEAQSSVLTFLNLAVVFALLAVVGAAAFLLSPPMWAGVLASLLGGVVLSRMCYAVATFQARQLANAFRVGFDLYRHAILTHLGLPIPGDVEEERALWARLGAEILARQPATGSGTGQA